MIRASPNFNTIDTIERRYIMSEDEALEYLYNEILCNDENPEEWADGFDD